MAALDFSRASTGRKAKNGYVGHRPRGAVGKLAQHEAKTKERRKAVIDDLKSDGKANLGSLASAVYKDSPEVRQKRLRDVRRKQLKSTFDLDVSSEDEVGIPVTRRGVRISDLTEEQLAVDDFELEDDLIKSSDEEADKQMSAEVTAMHFGKGNTLEDPEEDEALEGGPPTKRSRKEIYSELITKSKAAKAESAREKAQQHVLLAKIDDNFESVRFDVEYQPPKDPTSDTVKVEKAEKKLLKLDDSRSVKEKLQNDEFDRLMSAMKLAPRGVAASRLKTEAEIALDQKKRLEELEAERIRRSKQHETAYASTSDSEDDCSEHSGSESDRRDEENLISATNSPDASDSDSD